MSDYQKYRVFKIDDNMPDGPIVVEVGPGSFETLTEVEDPGMFLLFDDPAAQDAFWVYANSIKKKDPLLALHIKDEIHSAIERSQHLHGVDFDGDTELVNSSAPLHSVADVVAKLTTRSDIMVQPMAPTFYINHSQIQELVDIDEDGRDFAEWTELLKDHGWTIVEPMVDETCTIAHPLDCHRPVDTETSNDG